MTIVAQVSSESMSKQDETSVKLAQMEQQLAQQAQLNQQLIQLLTLQ